MISNVKQQLSADNFDYHVARQMLDKEGIVFFQNLYTESLGEDIANLFGTIHNTLDSTGNGITEITEEKSGKNVRNSRAFTRLSLYPHTDRSPMRKPPRYLLNWVQEAAQHGGETLLVDGWLLYEEMEKDYPKDLSILQTSIATFTDGINTHIDSIFKKDERGVISIRFRDDDCVLFADDAKPSVDCLRALIRKNLLTFELKTGDAYLLDNTRWLHGRNAYTGHRLICRLHINEG